MSEYSLVCTNVLTSYTATDNPAVHGIEVRIGWSLDDTLTLFYVLTGDCTRLRIPDARPQAQVDGLWQHTCFEVFVSAKDDAAYWEFNFSPSSEWATYQFRSYRDRTTNGEIVAPPQIVTHRTADRLELDVRLHLPHLLSLQPLQLGLSAVIEDENGKLSYWALKHPSGKPDFHHSDSFALEISPLVKIEATGKETR